jgi:hypothetical protein
MLLPTQRRSRPLHWKPYCVTQLIASRTDWGIPVTMNANVCGLWRLLNNTSPSVLQLVCLDVNLFCDRFMISSSYIFKSSSYNIFLSPMLPSDLILLLYRFSCYTCALVFILLLFSLFESLSKFPPWWFPFTSYTQCFGLVSCSPASVIRVFRIHVRPLFFLSPCRRMPK